MRIVEGVSGSSVRAKSGDIPKRLLAPIRWILRTGDPAATMDRLFVSQHVEDLRLVIAFASVAVILILFIESVARVASFLTFFTSVLGVYGAVLAWAYQAGSARLGVVDLFACEIDTLCRVALVMDSVPRSIESFQHALPGRSGAGNSPSSTRHFTSEENYFPVFENNTRDLQALEARVVVNITAFYTYMKAVRDSTRALMELSAPPVQPGPGPDKASTLFAWQDAARNVIYMMFLGLESAHKAIRDLVEFEPEQAERTIVILISELQAYRFLREQFAAEQDIRHQRLELRKADYEKLVPWLWSEVEAKWASKPLDWEPARRLVPELKRLYHTAINQPHRPRRLASTA